MQEEIEHEFKSIHLSKLCMKTRPNVRFGYKIDKNIITWQLDEINLLERYGEYLYFMGYISPKRIDPIR